MPGDQRVKQESKRGGGGEKQKSQEVKSKAEGLEKKPGTNQKKLT